MGYYTYYEFNPGIHLAVFGLSVMFVQISAGSFMEMPMSMNVTNGTEAEFHCKVKGTTITWIVNGTTASDTDDIVRTSIDFPGCGVVMSTLFISSNITYNNTDIVCQVIVVTAGEGDVNQSDLAVLKIQGPPAAVTTIATEFSNSQVHLTWTPPFTLDLTGVDVDIHYNIFITVSREESAYSLYCTACPLTIPGYSFPENSSLDPCGVYSFSVEPFNDAGRGPAQLLTNVHTPRPILSDHPVLEVAISPVLKFVVKILVTVYTFPAQVAFPLRIYMLQNEGSICTTTVQINSIDSYLINGELTDGQWQFVLDTDSGVRLNTRYSVTLTARNAGGSDDRITTLSTYDLQEAKIEEGSELGSINVTDIKFAINSSAVGFLSVIVNESGFAEHFEVFMKSGSVYPAVALGEGLYHVTLYDVEDDGEPQTSAAISSDITVPQGEPLQSGHYEVHSGNDGDDGLKVFYSSITNGTLCITCSFSSESLGCAVIVYSNDEPSGIQYYTTQAAEICPPVSTVTTVSVAVFNLVDRNGTVMIDSLPVNVMYFGPAGPTRGRHPENNTNLATILGAALGSFIAVFLAVSLIVLLLILIWKKHKALHSSEIVLQPNQVYDVVKQQQWRGRAVRLEPCSAYGVHEDVDTEPEYETVT